MAFIPTAITFGAITLFMLLLDLRARQGAPVPKEELKKDEFFKVGMWVYVVGVLGLIMSIVMEIMIILVAEENVSMTAILIISIIPLFFFILSVCIFLIEPKVYVSISDGRYTYFNGHKIKTSGRIEDIHLVYVANGSIHINAFDGTHQTIPAQFKDCSRLVEKLKYKRR